MVVARDPGRDIVVVPGGKASVFKGRAYRDGLFSVQDPVQMDAVEILAPRPGEIVWDACAAPGGKATQIAEHLQQEGRVVATDVNESRLSRLDENVKRLGLTNVDIAAYDAFGEAPPPGAPAEGFDAVLLDAPCSNTAVLGRRPEARWRFRDDSATRLAELQARLIASVRRHLKPGGRLIYSVCSFEPEEGRGHGLEPTRSELVFRD